MAGTFFIFVGLLFLLLGLVAPSSRADDIPAATSSNLKVFVCKYVGTPGVDERLQTGQNPIDVSVNALPVPADQVVIGTEFNDEQGRSLVIAFDTGQDPEPSVDDCPPPNGGTTTTTTSTTSTTQPTTTTSTTSTTSTTQPTTTTSTIQPTTSTTSVGISQFAFGAAGTECQAEVPVIVITFANTFPELAGQSGTLFIDTIGGDPVGQVDDVVYDPGGTVNVIYPGAEVDADGNIIDLPGWTLQSDGTWIIDPTDSFLRDGLTLTYVLGDEVATANVTYPPESSTCANPPPPGPTTTTTTVVNQTTTTLLTVSPPTVSPPTTALPRTGGINLLLVWVGLGFVSLGLVGLSLSRKVVRIQ